MGRQQSRSKNASRRDKGGDATTAAAAAAVAAASAATAPASQPPDAGKGVYARVRVGQRQCARIHITRVAHCCARHRIPHNTHTHTHTTGEAAVVAPAAEADVIAGAPTTPTKALQTGASSVRSTCLRCCCACAFCCAGRHTATRERGQCVLAAGCSRSIERASARRAPAGHSTHCPLAHCW
jgi:hypothetical protein